MKKIFSAVALITLAFMLMPCCAFAEREEKTSVPAEILIEARQSDIYVEGEVLGDLVLGARGSIQILYVDEPFSRAIADDTMLEGWVRMMGQYFGSDATRGKKMFIVHINVYKPWDFDPTEIFVGGYHLKKDDILSPSMTNPFGPLESKSEGFFAFAVPASEAKPGTEIKIGYGDDSTTWKVPK